MQVLCSVLCVFTLLQSGQKISYYRCKDKEMKFVTAFK